MIRRRIRRLRSLDVLAFAVVVLLAGIVTAQLPELTPDRTSAQVYPPQVSAIRFSHARHADQPCTTCHGAALTSQRAADSLRPTMQVCVGCHGGKAAPAIEECAGCHVGFAQRATSKVSTSEDWRAVRPAPMIPPQQQPALRFDHAHHVPRLGGEKACVACHAGSEPAMPSMQSCTTCHDSTSAPGTCTTCHPTGMGGKLQGARSGPGMTLRPDNHDVDFLRRHGSVAKSAPDDCMSCHVEQDCASCHTASMAKPFAVHPPNFLTIHAVDARSGAGNCSDCHAVQTFCTSCHVRADVMAAPPHAPPPQRRYHPPNWLEASAANNHGVMARRDIVECASCHAEADCISCHAGVNPHPPEFGLSCRRLMSANMQSCAKCHDDLAALRAICP